jgi:UDP-glucose 4-epimerase
VVLLGTLVSAGIHARALVTGATGFLGLHLCRLLALQGMTVQAVCRPESGALPLGVERFVCDLLDQEALVQVLRRNQPDYVFHLAGFTSAARELNAVLPSFHTNLTSTVNLLKAVAEVGCKRLVLAGSLEEPAGPLCIPSSPYAASKWAASTYACMFWQLFQTPVTIARIFMVYGPGQRDVKKLIPYTIRALLQRGELRFSSGLREVDWVFVEDVARGLVLLSQAENVNGESVDLGTGILTSVRNVVERLAQLVDPSARPAFGSLGERSAEQIRRADIVRTEALLGWKPSVLLDEGLRATVDYYVQQRELCTG